MEGQRFMRERVLALGPDLAAAYFLLGRGCRVRFKHQKGMFQSKYLSCSPDPTFNLEGTKGGFVSESAMCFSNLQKKLFQITILNLKFKFPANNSKQQIQISSSG